MKVTVTVHLSYSVRTDVRMLLLLSKTNRMVTTVMSLACVFVVKHLSDKMFCYIFLTCCGMFLYHIVVIASVHVSS